MSDITPGYLFAPSEGRPGLTSTKLNAASNGATINPSFVSGKPAVSSVTSADQLLLLKADGTYARVPATAVGGAGGGGGDMYKATYDTNNNGVVDTCDALAWSKLTGVPTTFPPDSTAMLKSVYDTNNNGICDTCDSLPLARVSGAGTAAAKDVPPPPGYATPSVVQAKDTGNPGGSFGSLSVTLTSSVAVGNALLVTVFYGSTTSTISQTISSVVDNLGNTYSLVSPFTTFIGFPAQAGGQAVYMAGSSVGSGSCTITVTLSGAAPYFIIGALEIHNSAGTVDVSVSAKHDTASPIAASPGSITTASPNDLILGIYGFFDGPATSGQPWTTQLSDYVLFVNSTVAATASSYTPTANSSGTGGWVATTVALLSFITASNASSSQVVMGSDTRLTDSRTPKPHESTHITGGSDLIPAPTVSASGLVPVLPASLASSKFLRGDATFIQPDYSNLTGVPSSFIPVAHHATHITGGSDLIPVATTSATGLVPLLSGDPTTFLNGNGVFSAVGGSGTVDPGVWTTLSLGTGWTAPTQAQFRVQTAGAVKTAFFRGMIQAAWAGLGATAFTLPSTAFPSMTRSAVLAGAQNTGTASDVASYIASVSSAGVATIYFLAASAFVWADHSQTQQVYLDGLSYSL